MVILQTDRRAFLAGAGCTIANSLTSIPAFADLKPGPLFASAYRRDGNGYGVLLFDENGTALSDIKLPGRGHDIAFSSDKRTGVAFARRPGNFALAFSTTHAQVPVPFEAPAGRHFYGHGAFSGDGKLLYATENDFEKAAGVIGIYDATDRFNRIGEFSTYGIGPHELVIGPDEHWLAVANGGIETHPDFGRAKLNLPTMKPSIAFIDRLSGALLENHFLPEDLHQLSIRHLDVDASGKVFYGCQYQGSKTDFPPLVGSTALGSEMSFLDVPADKWKRYANYVGSVAFSPVHNALSVTMPKANKVVSFEATTGRLIRETTVPRAFGVAASNAGFVVSSETGVLIQGHRRSEYSNLEFDNHIAV